MKRNKIIQSIKIITLGLILSLGISYVFSAVGDGMGGGGIALPPSLNVSGPVNVGPSDQTKSGGLDVGVVSGNLRVLNGGFLSNGPAIFNDVVGIGVQFPAVKLDVNGAVKFGNQVVSPACVPVTAGSVRYNSTLAWMEYCNGVIWTSLGGANHWSKDGSKLFTTVLTDNVGIGTNTPTDKLVVFDSNGPSFQLGESPTKRAVFKWKHNSASLNISNKGTIDNMIVLDSNSGNVGILTDDYVYGPAKLQVNGPMSTDSIFFTESALVTDGSSCSASAPRNLSPCNSVAHDPTNPLNTVSIQTLCVCVRYSNNSYTTVWRAIAQ